MKVLVWADGKQELYVRRSLMEAADTATSVDWTVNFDKGTYIGKRSPGGVDMHQKVTPLSVSPTPIDGEAILRTWTAEYAVDIGEYVGGAALTRTVIRPTWSDCRDSDGQTFVYVTEADSLCIANHTAGWSNLACNRYANLDLPAYGGNPITASTVANYQRPSTSDAPQDYISVGVRLDMYYGGQVYSVFSGSRTNGAFSYHEDFPFPEQISGGDCGFGSDPTDGGGTGGTGTGSGSGSSGGGGGAGPTCVDVYDGESGAKLGVCCGYTTSEIVECAEGYL